MACYNTAFADQRRLRMFIGPDASSRQQRIGARLFLAVLVAASLTSGCSTTPSVTEQTAGPVLAAPTSTEAALVDLVALPPTQAIDTALRWARDYLSAGRTAAAQSMVEWLRPEQLSGQQLLSWATTTSLLHLARQEPDQALGVLDLPRVNQALSDAPPEVVSRAALLRADALTLKGELLKSLRERVRVDQFLSADQRQYNRQMIWTQLMMIPAPELDSARSRADNPGLIAWLELASLYRDPLTDIDTQIRKLDDWRGRWPNHPAAANLPGIIQALQQAVKDRPRSVAVLLPLEGSLGAAAAAIRDGLLTAYYSALEQGYPAPQLAFYNTTGNDIIALYNQALDAGAQLIIGPLDKERVDTLARVNALPVPTLTLNYADLENDKPAENLFQFGLAPEDEARQIADQALIEGARLAAVLYPEGEWGTRVAEAFRQRFESRGGIVSTHLAYGQDATGATRRLLDIGQSQGRASALQRFTGLKVNFEPRRRQDIDIVFMVANPAQARQLKPALNFNYASDLPVMATSYVYGGSPSPGTDADLNGIRFVDIPWLLDQESRLHTEAGQVWPGGHGRYERLFAMGIDAYRLHARLSMLHAIPDSFLPGVTGQLRVDAQRRLVRELQWAYFSQGKPQRMPVVAGSGEQDHGTAVVAPATR